MGQQRRDPDLAQKPLGAELQGEIAPQRLHRHFAVMLAVLGEIDGGHAAPPQLAFDRVAGGECGSEVERDLGRVGHSAG